MASMSSFSSGRAQNSAQLEKGRFESGPKLLVRKGGLEPPRFYPPDPKSGASANSATFATFLIIQSGETAATAPRSTPDR
jgi:hypothetical protein